MIMERNLEECVRKGKIAFKQEKVFYVLRYDKDNNNNNNNNFMYLASKTPDYDAKGDFDFENGYYQKWELKYRWLNKINESYKCDRETKLCIKCNKEKPYSDFSKSNLTIDGYHTYCKECRSNINKEYSKTPKGKKAIYKAVKKHYHNKKKKKIKETKETK